MIMALLAGLTLSGVDQARLNDLTPGWEVREKPILWGFHNLYNPQVVHEPGAEYPFKMWFFGYAAEDNNPKYPGGDAIYHARSKNLDDWEVYIGDGRWDASMDARRFVPVLYPDPEAFDNMASGDPSVVRHGGVYYMAYSGVRFDTRRAEDGKDHLYLENAVMGACSRDGIHWTRTKKPIIMWARERDVPWEIVDGKIPPCPKGYYGAYHRPALLFDEGKWRLWFDYMYPGTFVSMGYAENQGDFMDPGQWRVARAAREPLLKDWPNTAVVRDGGTYYAVSDAPNYPPEMGGDGRQLTLATSPDGIGWTVQGHLRPNGPASSHVPEALVIDRGGKRWLYIFYSWKPACEPGKEWDFRYKEIRYMRKALD